MSTCGWHRMIANLKLALPLIYHLALVIPLNHGLFIHLKNEHSLHLPHKDVVRAGTATKHEEGNLLLLHFHMHNCPQK